MSESMVRTRDLAEFGLLSVEAAAARRKWKLPTLQRWIQEGKIPVVAAGSGRNRTVYLMAVEDVDAFQEPPMGRPKLADARARRPKARKV